ncbi:MAG: restriction endonuclease subunit S [Sphingomonadaceae bacterium]
MAPLKRLTRFGYGDAIAADDRDSSGPVLVYGSNGPFDRHSAANTLGPCIVVGRKGSYGKCQYSETPVFAVDTTFVVDRRHTEADLRYLFHLLGILGLDELSDDTAVPGLSREKAYQSLAPLPPLETQKRIAAFLDEKTARIDALIAKKQALLDRLAEKRQAIITHAVTKGLNPGAPMKDSGIDWLGQIPAHWEVNCCNRRYSRRMMCRHFPPYGSRAGANIAGRIIGR